MAQERHECRQIILSNLLVAFIITLKEVIDKLHLELRMATEASTSSEAHFSKFVLNTYQYFQYLLDVFWQTENREIVTDADDIQILLATMQAAYSNDVIQQTLMKGNEYCLHDNFH